MKIAVYGSAALLHPEGLKKKAYILGHEIAKAGAVLVTGACPGLPFEAVKGAKGGEIIGYSPYHSIEEQEEYGYPTQGFTTIHYTGLGRFGRNIKSVKAIDAAIFINGGLGTLNEFTLAYYEGKIIGGLAGSGGIVEVLPQVVQAVNRDTGAIFIMEKEPTRLVKKIINLLYK